MQSFTVCFLLPLIFTVHARVVDKFDSKDKCMDFLYKGVEPKLDASINDVRICQTFADQPRFATLYDTANRIPVYSAYTYEYKGGAGCNATFTLTNVVPQNAKLNEVPWNNYEEKLKNTFKGCKTAHVVANTNRINIPDYLWHAYCCVDNKGKFKTGAAAVRNENTPVVECSIDSLEEFFVKPLVHPLQHRSADGDTPDSAAIEKTDGLDPQFSSRMQSFTVCFLLPLIFTVHTEVVERFEGTCDQFFYNGVVPQLEASNNDVRICQTFAN
ncbi:hypothetical protein INR49_006475, partial [Caranx melampygus]